MGSGGVVSGRAPASPKDGQEGGRARGWVGRKLASLLPLWF